MGVVSGRERLVAGSGYWVEWLVGGGGYWVGMVTGWEWLVGGSDYWTGVVTTWVGVVILGESANQRIVVSRQ